MLDLRGMIVDFNETNTIITNLCSTFLPYINKCNEHRSDETDRYIDQK